MLFIRRDTFWRENVRLPVWEPTKNSCPAENSRPTIILAMSISMAVITVEPAVQYSFV